MSWVTRLLSRGLLAVLALSLWCDQAPCASLDHLTAGEGDLAQIAYVAKLDDGRIVATNMPQVANQPGTTWVPGARAPKEPIPEPVLLGKSVMPFDLTKALPGMKVGETRRYVIDSLPEIGPRVESKVVRYPCERSFPRQGAGPVGPFIEETGRYPMAGNEFPLSDMLIAKITQVRGDTMSFEVSPLADDFQTPYGRVRALVQGDKVSVFLTPELGASFAQDGEMGQVVDVDAESFRVDYNHPLAGRPVNVEVRLVELVKAVELEHRSIQWIEGEAAGRAASRDTGKPLVLLFYANECSICHTFFDNTVLDPRLRAWATSFVWARVELSEDLDVVEKYAVRTVPAMVTARGGADTGHGAIGDKGPDELWRMLYRMYTKQ